MPKTSKAVRLAWSIFALGAGVTCIIALIQGNGALARANVISLGVLGTIFFFCGAIGLKLHKAPFPIGTPIRLVILFMCSAALMGLVCWYEWPQTRVAVETPKPKEQVASTPTPATSPTPQQHRVSTLAPTPTTTPVLETVHIVRSRQIPSSHADAPFGWEVSVQTSVPLQPITLNIEFDEPISFVEFSPTDDYTGMVSGGREVATGNPRIAVVTMLSPVFVPEHAMVVRVFSKTLSKAIGLRYQAGHP